ncbi:CcdB family protein [Propionivibrio dicarboxylicus]
MVTQYLSAIQAKTLKKSVCTLTDCRDEITAALDLLFFGF